MLRDAVEDYDFSRSMSVDELVLQMGKAWGFTAGKIAVGVDVLQRMFDARTV